MRSSFATALFAASILAAQVAGAASKPVDGFCWANAWWAPEFNRFAASSPYWEGGVVPRDGGVGVHAEGGVFLFRFGVTH